MDVKIEPPSLDVTWNNSFEYRGFSINGKPFTPKIYEGSDYKNISADFNAVLISIPADVKADLQWKRYQQMAAHARDNNFLILFELNFDFLNNPLTVADSSQYLSYQIVLDHFKDSLWKEFATHTLGVCLYKGMADFAKLIDWKAHDYSHFQEWVLDRLGASHHFDFGNSELLSFNENVLRNWAQKPETKLPLQLYCRDLFIDYLDFLSSALPAELPLFLMIDCSNLETPSNCLQLISLEKFERYHLVLKEPLYDACLSWKNGTNSIGYISEYPLHLNASQTSKIGVLLPSAEHYVSQPFESVANTIKTLKLRGVPFRTIPEFLFAHQWENLDFIAVEPSGLTSFGKRLLRGFCAAGGIVLNLGKSSEGFSEIPFSDWLYQK